MMRICSLALYGSVAAGWAQAPAFDAATVKIARPPAGQSINSIWFGTPRDGAAQLRHTD